ncbi:unnamed protein product [Effrenium voratum]|nr:unnamed protein product [Effrenium voratum]|mmetsp:Transcript_116460/g.276826  ORF Transcript_116460/g.276826 Transcript_116460/m.276826 type:complete len:255 (-) Transcript_116460:131-895(-)
MAGLKLRYHNSFIDVDEEGPASLRSKVRASSEPPLNREFVEEEESLHFTAYVAGLSKKLAEKEQEGSPCSWLSTEVSSGEAPSVADWVETSPDGRDLDLPSQGSLGHPEVCRRPCIYFLAGHCENGDSCSYCHMEHKDKMPKLDKRQRTIMQGLSRRELLALVLYFCRSKADQAGMIEAQEIIRLLEDEASGQEPLPASISERDVRNLHKTLARMNFSNLIGLVTHSSSGAKHAPESAERLSEALERMRWQYRA